MVYYGLQGVYTIWNATGTFYGLRFGQMLWFYSQCSLVSVWLKARSIKLNGGHGVNKTGSHVSSYLWVASKVPGYRSVVSVTTQCQKPITPARPSAWHFKQAPQVYVMSLSSWRNLDPKECQSMVQRDFGKAEEENLQVHSFWEEETGRLYTLGTCKEEHPLEM